MSRADDVRSEILKKVKEYYQLTQGALAPFVPGQSKIPYAGRVYDERELQHAVDASLDFWLTAGRFAEQFEERLASFLGIRYCSLCNSGSSANLLAFMALTSPTLGDRQIKKRDEVITVAAGFPTTITPIVQYGAVPVFVDVTLPTYNIDVLQLEAAKSGKTKAVVLAHTLGNPFNINVVKEFCERYQLWLIEDNCDSLGAQYNDRFTGTFGHLGTSSFYPPHHITLGEGGAVYTQHEELYHIVNSFRDWGRDCWCAPGKDDSCGKRFDKQFGQLPAGFDHKFVYSHFGYNLKITDLQAAIGCAQLEKLPSFLSARQKNYMILKKGLESLKDIFWFSEPTPGSKPSWFGFLMTIKPKAGFTRNQLVDYLEKKRIQTRNLFAGNLIKHPCFDSLRLGDDFQVVGSLAQTDLIMHNTFWIGVYPGLTEEMLAFAIQCIQAFVHAQR